MKPLIDLAQGQTLIDSNGGGLPEPIEALFAVLETHTLDPIFEEYGDFVEIDPVNSDGDAIYPKGTASFFGNFADLSHVFNIATRDADLAARLTAAIRANKAAPRYAAEKVAAAKRKAANLAYQKKQDEQRRKERQRLARQYLETE